MSEIKRYWVRHDKEDHPVAIRAYAPDRAALIYAEGMDGLSDGELLRIEVRDPDGNISFHQVRATMTVTVLENV